MSEVKTGIYEIKNVITGKRYIGSAALSFKRRWSTHKCNLRKNFHHSPYLQNSWNKHGEKSFEFNILEYVPPEFCVMREQYWIDFHNAADVKFGYNICPTAGSRIGSTHTEETKSKMRGRTHTEESRSKMRGKIVSEETRLKLSKAGLCRTHTEETRLKLSKAGLGRIVSEESKLKMSLAKLGKYTYKITKPNNDEIIVSNLREFCKNNGLHNGAMCNVANGKRKQHKGFTVIKIS